MQNIGLFSLFSVVVVLFPLFNRTLKTLIQYLLTETNVGWVLWPLFHSTWYPDLWV